MPRPHLEKPDEPQRVMLVPAEGVITLTPGSDLPPVEPEERSPGPLTLDACFTPLVGYRGDRAVLVSTRDTHERIALLEERLAENERLLAELPPKLAEATRQVEGFQAELQAARDALTLACIRDTKWNRERYQNAAQQPRVEPLNYEAESPDRWMESRALFLHECPEWLRREDLENTRNDPRSEHGLALRVKRETEKQLTDERHAHGVLESWLFEHREHLGKLAERDRIARARAAGEQPWYSQEFLAHLDELQKSGRFLGWRKVP